uniref:Srp40 C-terminal domain-containing protein n=1 Tax=Syphacia muris TaxID=451379 RepID=A0A0N5APC4_9BILA
MADTNDVETTNDTESCEETNENAGEVVLEEDLESDKDDGQQQEEQVDEEGIAEEDNNSVEEKVEAEDEAKQDPGSRTEDIQEDKEQPEIEEVETTSANTGMPVNNDPEPAAEEGAEKNVNNNNKEEGSKIKEHEAPEKGTVSKIKSMWQSGEVYNQSSNVKEKDSSYKKAYGVGQGRTPVNKTAYEKNEG